MKSVNKSSRFVGTLKTFAAASVLATATNAALAQTLPDPGTVVNGVPLDVQYDDGHSYSTKVLNYFFPDAGWNTAAGTGTLDVLITTRSSGQSNSNGALAGYNIPDPTTNPNTNPIDDSWGTTATTGTMLVNDLYRYLQDFFNATVPVFTFDQNETGGNPDLNVTAKVEIIDPQDGVLYLWSLDNLLQAGDGDYDPDEKIVASGEIVIPDSLDKCAGQDDAVCVFDNNVGSGKFDYIIYVPTMDLTPFLDNCLGCDNDNIFRVTWHFDGVDDGGEEITLTGRFTGTVCPDPELPQCQVLPEPTPLSLIGLALLGLFGVRRLARA